MRLKWYRFHDNRVYELYSMLIDADSEETVLDRLNHMPSRIVVNYPGAAINGKVRIEYWKAQEYAHEDEEARLERQAQAHLEADALHIDDPMFS